VAGVEGDPTYELASARRNIAGTEPLSRFIENSRKMFLLQVFFLSLVLIHSFLFYSFFHAHSFVLILYFILSFILSCSVSSFLSLFFFFLSVSFLFSLDFFVSLSPFYLLFSLVFSIYCLSLLSFLLSFYYSKKSSSFTRSTCWQFLKY